MIKLVLKDYDWLSIDELKEKVNVIYNKISKSKEREGIRQDTFTKAINSLLIAKEITIKKIIESKDNLEYNPYKDKVKYQFKLTSNFSFKLSPQIKTDELMGLLKQEYTDYLFRENVVSNIKEHNTDKLDIEIEAYDRAIKKVSTVTLYNREITTFLIDIYKYNSPNEAYTYFEKLTKFKIDSSYADVTTNFKDMSDTYCEKSVDKINFQYKSYYVKIDNSEYTTQKFKDSLGFNKTIFLVYNLIIVIYNPKWDIYKSRRLAGIEGSIDIFNIIQKYILSQ